MAAQKLAKEQDPAAWRNVRTSLLVSVVVLAACAGLVALYIHSLPPVQPELWDAMRTNFPPGSFTALRQFRDAVLSYAGEHKVRVGVAVAIVYIAMQTFAVPGTTSLSLVTGALFGRWVGFVLVALISTVGSSSCYTLSWAVGRPLVHAVWPDKLQYFQREVSSRRGQLLNYMLFLRVTPLLPNTFINVASPIVGVPLHIFFLATLLGCAPNNFVAANAGANLGSLNSMKDLADPRMVGLGLIVGAVAILPVFWKPKQQQQQQSQKQQQDALLEGTKKEL